MSDEFDPRTFHIEHEKDGFVIVNDYGEDMEPTQIFSSYLDACERISEMVVEYLDNYEPPDPPGFEAGFAENH